MTTEDPIRNREGEVARATDSVLESGNTDIEQGLMPAETRELTEAEQRYANLWDGIITDYLNLPAGDTKPSRWTRERLTTLRRATSEVAAGEEEITGYSSVDGPKKLFTERKEEFEKRFGKDAPKPNVAMFRAFERFDIGGQVRSYAEHGTTSKWNKGVDAKRKEQEVSVAFRASTAGGDVFDDVGKYEIHFPGLEVEDESDRWVNTRTDVPEVAKMVYDHVMTADVRAEDIGTEAERYADELLNGRGFESENKGRTANAYGKMHDALRSISQAAREAMQNVRPNETLSKKIEEKDFIALKQHCDRKRAEIIDRWKKEIREIQDDDAMEKARKKIEAL
jgi:hypothetical protein